MSSAISAKQVSIMAMTATLFALFFYLSGLIAVPNFTFLYLPIILLGIFPIWFGWSGLVGSMIGAVIGGFLVEGLGAFAWIEATTALVIYALNWILIPRRATEGKLKWTLSLFAVYAATLFIGTVCILWQLTALVGIFTPDIAQAFLLPVFGLNFAIEILICPALIRALSPKMKSWGIYAGNFSQWRTLRQTKPNTAS
jgi:hypothetical protein